MTHARQYVLCSITLMLLGTACGTQQGGSNDTPKPAVPDSAAMPASGGAGAMDSTGYLVQIARLEAEARALARTTGCNSADQCRTAPVGERACGGPRSFIVYCAATTDSVALFKKLDELRELEMKYNAASGMASTCEMRMPPMPSVSGGSCRAP
jgi:hypothetical protein